MIRNCFHFNPAGTPVNMAGIELQRVFDEKWKNIPQPKEHTYDDDMDAEDDDSEDDSRMFPFFYFTSQRLQKLVSRDRRDGKTDRGHAGNDFCAETAEEGKAAKEGSSSTADAYRFFIQQTR